MQKITPCLWFESRAEEAVDHYMSIFDDARVLDVLRYTEAGPGEPGAVLTVTFELAGQQFTALNGGPHDRFNDAISLSVECASQEEVDYYWEKLCEGGQEVQCGWLKDKYGVSWQVTPIRLYELLKDSDPARAARVTERMFGMKKLDIKELEAAAQ
jgi:predicted 3-demethylubiquinone-9 3-methyltransferase (glyoxalase superfamily)